MKLMHPSGIPAACQWTQPPPISRVQVEAELLEVPGLMLLSQPCTVLSWDLGVVPLPLSGCATVAINQCAPTPLEEYVERKAVRPHSAPQAESAASGGNGSSHHGDGAGAGGDGGCHHSDDAGSGDHVTATCIVSW